MVDPSHEHYDWSVRRTVASVVLVALAVVVGIRLLALAADAIGVQPTVVHYLALVLPVLVAPVALVRLHSDARFDDRRYREDRETAGLVRDVALGVVVAYVGFAGFVVLLDDLPTVVIAVLGTAEGTLLGVTATMGAAREFYDDDDAHPSYFGLLDRLPP